MQTKSLPALLLGTMESPKLSTSGQGVQINTSPLVPAREKEVFCFLHHHGMCSCNLQALGHQPGPGPERPNASSVCLLLCSLQGGQRLKFPQSPGKVGASERSSLMLLTQIVRVVQRPTEFAGLCLGCPRDLNFQGLWGLTHGSSHPHKA